MIAAHCIILEIPRPTLVKLITGAERLPAGIPSDSVLRGVWETPGEIVCLLLEHPIMAEVPAGTRCPRWKVNTEAQPTKEISTVTVKEGKRKT